MRVPETVALSEDHSASEGQQASSGVYRLFVSIFFCAMKRVKSYAFAAGCRICSDYCRREKEGKNSP